MGGPALTRASAPTGGRAWVQSGPPPLPPPPASPPGARPSECAGGTQGASPPVVGQSDVMGGVERLAKPCMAEAGWTGVVRVAASVVGWLSLVAGPAHVPVGAAAPVTGCLRGLAGLFEARPHPRAGVDRDAAERTPPPRSATVAAGGPWQATRTSSRGGGRARRRTAQHCTPPATPGRGMSRSRNQPPMPNTARSAGVKWGEEDQGLKFARSDCQRMSYAHSRNGGGVAHPQRQLGQDETRSLVHKLGGNS